MIELDKLEKIKIGDIIILNYNYNKSGVKGCEVIFISEDKKYGICRNFKNKKIRFAVKDAKIK